MRRIANAVALLCTVALSAVGVLVGTALPAAAETAGWAQWGDLEGSAGNYTTTMQLPAAGFPEATMTSDSRGGVGVISGASNWVGADTPPGEIYGSSRNERYINLRPRADRPDAPSTTTYTFDSPTPPGGWAFVLGDIDADEVTVTAKGPDGQELSVGELGFQGTFNLCQASDSPSCTDDDEPTWDPATQTLTGNEAAADTNGASGWFQPTAPIKTLTFTFRQRSGFPVYQTWFASLARDIAGTVYRSDQDDDPVSGATVKLFGPDGSELATATTDDEGNYSFPGYTATDGYAIEIVRPSGLTMDEDAGDDGIQRQAVDLSDADDLDVDLALRAIIPVEVNGCVADTDGNPIADATVTLDDHGTATTDSDGFYVFEEVPPGTYSFSAEADGYTIQSTPDDITVPEDSEEPIEDNCFVLDPLPSLSGQVTAGGSGVGNVTVTIEGPDGFSASTVTDSDGNYQFEKLPPGDYTVSIEPPSGYQVVDDVDSRDETAADQDVPDVDFALFRPGAIGGTVIDEDGEFVPGATIEITGPDGAETVTTDDEGNYYLDGLPPGDYTIAITPPDGYTVVSDETLEVTLTTAGESHLDQDFVLALVDDEVPGNGDGNGNGNGNGNGDGAEPGKDAEPGKEAGDDALPATGVGAAALGLVGVGLIIMGIATLRVRRLV